MHTHFIKIRSEAAAGMLFEHMAQVKFVYKKRGAYLVQGELFPNVLIDVHHNCGKLVVGLVWRKAMIRAEIKYFKESAGIIPADGRLQKAEFCLNSFTGVIIQDKTSALVKEGQNIGESGYLG